MIGFLPILSEIMPLGIFVKAYDMLKTEKTPMAREYDCVI